MRGRRRRRRMPGRRSAASSTRRAAAPARNPGNRTLREKAQGQSSAGKPPRCPRMISISLSPSLCATEHRRVSAPTARSRLPCTGRSRISSPRTTPCWRLGGATAQLPARSRRRWKTAGARWRWSRTRRSGARCCGTATRITAPSGCCAGSSRTETSKSTGLGMPPALCRWRMEGRGRHLPAAQPTGRGAAFLTTHMKSCRR